jgi:hypothetical protein
MTRGSNYGGRDNVVPQILKRSGAAINETFILVRRSKWLRLRVVTMRLLCQTFDFCITVLFVLVVTYAVAVAIEKTADRAAARNVFDALVHDTCTHPAVGCRVT